MSLKDRCLKPPAVGKPYMISMKAGKNRSWEPFSKGMTHAFVLEFATQEDLDYYITEDPVHIAFSRVAGPLLEDSLVVDIVDGQLFATPAKRPHTYPGKCHCGEIQFNVYLPPANIVSEGGPTTQHILCHCGTCQRLGGGPYSCNQIIPREDLTITDGALSKYTYTGASGKPVDCFFCSKCTSHIYHEQGALPGKVIVRTLLLEGGEKWSVGGEIFAEGRANWVQDLHGALP